MRKYNQYTQDVLDYNREHGTDLFLEYKQKDTTEERKKEIEDFLFGLMSDKREIPIPILSDVEIYKSMVTFSNVRWDTVYKDGYFYPNQVGIDILYQFFPEMNDVKKKGGCKSIREYMFDDNLLRKVVKKSLSYIDNELGIYRIFFWCGAGNSARFRPTSSKALYEVYGRDKKDCKVFDSSVGFGAEVLAAHFAENVSEFVGIDPNTADSCRSFSEYLIDNFDTGTRYEFLKIGSEDFTEENYPQYQNYFDLSFTSPPYFDTERYSEDDTQSYKKFPTYIGWIKGFYQETIHNTCNALKHDGVFSINIFNKIPKIPDITKAFLADNGWYVVRVDTYMMRSLPGMGKVVDGEIKKRGNTIWENSEPIYVAYHWSRLYESGLISKEKALEYKNRAVRDNKRIEIE